MMAKGHAVGGAAVWLTGWSWTAVAGLAQPRADVLTVGTLICAGAALLPDLDHPNSRLARVGGLITYGIALVFGWIGRHVHAATKLDADRPDLDGHRTITHTLVFAGLTGTLIAGIAGLSDDLGAWLAGRTGLPIAPLGKLLTAVIVYVFVQIGAAALRANFGGRRRKVPLLPPKGNRKRGRARVHKSTAVALLCAVASYALVPGDVWWLGLAVGVGCVAHCLGDVITASGCPILWPLPVPSRGTRYDRTLRRRVPVVKWRTWYLVGTPRWCRFRVGSPTEAVVTWCLLAWIAVPVAGLVYAIGRVPSGG